MSNPSYTAGVRLEREIMNLLKEYLDPEKYTIIRTAGSHSPVDIVVLKHIGLEGKDREYFGIQCKTKKKKKNSKWNRSTIPVSLVTDNSEHVWHID